MNIQIFAVLGALLALTTASPIDIRTDVIAVTYARSANMARQLTTVADLIGKPVKRDDNGHEIRDEQQYKHPFPVYSESQGKGCIEILIMDGRA